MQKVITNTTHTNIIDTENMFTEIAKAGTTADMVTLPNARNLKILKLDYILSEIRSQVTLLMSKHLGVRKEGR